MLIPLRIKQFIQRAYQSDHILEILFSSLRWFFLVLSFIVFFIQYASDPVEGKLQLFTVLIIFGIMYMAMSDYSLYKTPEGSTMYRIMTKGGPFFDYIAFLFLISLTGGIYSPLFPIAYLIILHASVYWKFTGAVISSFSFIIGHTLLLLLLGFPSTSSEMTTYFTQLFFLFFTGFLGGIIVSRERKHYSEKTVYEGLAKKDYLTNLYNHRSFQIHLRENLNSDNNFYLVLADIDDFKKINDQYGHVMGDKVLKNIGKLLTDIIPESLGSAYRYGGEEFAIIIYSDDVRIVQSLLERIKAHVSAKVYNEEVDPFTVTMSFGSSQKMGNHPNQLVDFVDKLLYEAKRKGRNHIVINNEQVL